MFPIRNMLSELEDRKITQAAGSVHDEFRMGYRLGSNKVPTFHEFNRGIGDYYNHHFTACVSFGGILSMSESTSRAKELLEKEYRRQGGDIVTAFNDAHDGTNGGMRKILDIIAEGLKAESVERYVRDVFDHYVAPNSWEQKVEIIRQFFSQCGVYLSSSVRIDQPERYAQSYQELITCYVEALKGTSSIFRRF